MVSILKHTRRHQAAACIVFLFGLSWQARAGTLTLSGTPPATATVGQLYDFQPTASGATGSTHYYISNKPAWLTFDRYTARLFGTPAAADVATYSNIVISANNGKKKVSLAPFGITVSQPASTSTSATSTSTTTLGAATLSWVAPAYNVDGTLLTNLAGYHVLYGTDPNQLAQQLDLPSPDLTSVEIADLSSGTYYFEVTAYTTTALESAPSQMVSKSIL